MANGRRSGGGCGTVVLVFLIVALLGAWQIGAFDRLAYLLHFETGRTQVQSQVEVLSPDEVSWYVFSQLSDEDQEKYLILLDSFRAREPRTYPETTMEDLTRMRDCVLADHPELYYISGVQIQTTSNAMLGLVTDVAVEGQYYFSEEETQQLQPQIEAAVAECLAGMPADSDDYGKAKYLYEYLASTITYDHGALWEGQGALGGSSGQTIAEALVARNAVCAGYAQAYQYLLRLVGVPCVYVTGTAKGGSHAWCVAFLDGSWYNVDPTWGDPQFQSEGEGAYGEGYVNYDYLCVTDADIAPTHVPDSPYPLPLCVSDADNYYVREGLYVISPDVSEAGAIIDAAVQRGEDKARFRCSNWEVFDEIVSSLFDGQEVYRFIPGNSCSYILGENMLTVEVAWEG